MKTATPRLRRSLIAIAVLATIGIVGCATTRLGEAKKLADRSEPLQQQPAEPRLTLLVVGDSTAVGTGASAPQASLAGLMAASHPQLAIENRSADGARFEDLPAQLAAAIEHRYDLVLVQAGGNDVIRLTSEDALRRAVDETLTRAKALAPQVIVMPAGNVGNAPFFHAPVSWLMTRRARTLHAAVREAASAHGAVFVNLFFEKADDPFVKNPALHASDGLHPSDAGYRSWWGSLRQQSDLETRLAAAR